MPETAPAHVPLSARCVWVDAARVLAMLFIVLCHQYFGGLTQNTIIATGSLCAFFFLSGYFQKRGTLAGSFKRAGIMFLCYYAWGFVNLLLSQKLAGLNAEEMVKLLYCGGGVYWFLRALCVGILCGTVFARLNDAYKLVVLLALFFTCVVSTSLDESHIFQRLELSTFVFCLGIYAQRVSLPLLGGALFSSRKGVNIAVSLAALAAFGALLTNTFTAEAILPHMPILLLTMIVAWILFALSYATEQYLAAFSRMIAKCGPAVVLVYVLHHPIIRVYSSAWCQYSGDMPPAWFDLAFICVLFPFCCHVTQRLRGKNRWTDIFLFAR